MQNSAISAAKKRVSAVKVAEFTKSQSVEPVGRFAKISPLPTSPAGPPPHF
jgi:hypothetical protein